MTEQDKAIVELPEHDLDTAYGHLLLDFLASSASAHYYAHHRAHSAMSASRRSRYSPTAARSWLGRTAAVLAGSWSTSTSMPRASCSG